MLKSIQLQNWRSLRDVTLDELTPITVLIGPNASGKTNLIDALYFVRDYTDENLMQAVYNREGGGSIRSRNAHPDDVVTVSFTSSLPGVGTTTKRMEMRFGDNSLKFDARSMLLLEGETLLTTDWQHLPPPEISSASVEWDTDGKKLNQLDRAEQINGMVREYVQSRWQFLDENFLPPYSQLSSVGGIYVIDRCADNVVFMLDFIRQTRPEIYEALQADLRFLLGFVERLRVDRQERETRILLHETRHPEREAPTLSAGTLRIMAMLVAYHALDLQKRNLPGLVVIEEPDSALNPGLLRRFVELLRDYVARDETRQFILTTHNPTFLNLFRPEEVRVVNRNENGDTTVERVPGHITQTWLDEYGLGEVWLTNSFGGVAE